MADLDFAPSDTEVSSHPVSTGGAEKPSFDPNSIGQHCAFPWTPQPMYVNNDDTPVVKWEQFEDDPDNPRDVTPLSESARQALMQLGRDLFQGRCGAAAH